MAGAASFFSVALSFSFMPQVPLRQDETVTGVIEPSEASTFPLFGSSNGEPIPPGLNSKQNSFDTTSGDDSSSSNSFHNRLIALSEDLKTAASDIMTSISSNKWAWLGAAGATLIGYYLYTQGREAGNMPDISSGYKIGASVPPPSPPSSSSSAGSAAAPANVRDIPWFPPTSAESAPPPMMDRTVDAGRTAAHNVSDALHHLPPQNKA